MIPKIPTRDDFRGRFGDTKSAHVTPGEVVVPRTITDDPRTMALIAAAFEQAGMDPDRYTVGSPEASINPMTGNEEFFDWRSIAGAFVPGLISDFLPIGDLLNIDNNLLSGALDIGAGALGHNLLTGSDLMTSLGASLGSGIGRWAGNEFFGGGGGDAAGGLMNDTPIQDTSLGFRATPGDGFSLGSGGDGLGFQASPASYGYDLAGSVPSTGFQLPAGFTSPNVMSASSYMPGQDDSILGRLGDLNINDMLYGAAGAYLGSQLAGGGMKTPEPKRLNIPNMPTANVPSYGGNNAGSMAPPTTGSGTQIGTQTGTSSSTQIGTSIGATPNTGIRYMRPTTDRDTGRQQWQSSGGPGQFDRRQGWGGGVTFI